MVPNLARLVTAPSLLCLCACNIDPAAVACDSIDGRNLAPAGGMLMGVNLEWGRETLAEYSDKLGERPAVAATFADVPFAPEDPEPLGAAAVTDGRAGELAALLAGFDTNGVPVIVRIAHEMNGSWYPWVESELPEEGTFAARLTGTFDGADGDESMLPDFYAVYGVGHGKPVAVRETAAPVRAGTGSPRTLDIRRAWWQQVFDPAIQERFPQLAMVNWFEWNKAESEVGSAVDRTVVEDPAIRAGLTAALPDRYRFAEEPEDCGEPLP